MKRRVFLFLMGVSILFFHVNSGCQDQGDAFLVRTDSTADHPGSTDSASGEIIVKFKPEAFNEEGELAAESIMALNAEYSLLSMEPLFKGMPSGIYALKFPEGVDVNKLVEEYVKDPYVVYAEPNYLMRALEEGQNAD